MAEAEKPAWEFMMVFCHRSKCSAARIGAVLAAITMCVAPSPSWLEGASDPAVSKQATAKRATPAGGDSSTAGSIRFSVDPAWRSDDREQRMTYGLNVAPPWPGGGKLFINYPEHLEYNPQGNTILRHWDDRPSPWMISPDGRQASFRVESLAVGGCVVEAFARVANPRHVPAGTEGIYLAMRIRNGSDKTLPVIRPLICLQYRGLTGFPQYVNNYKHNFIVMGGKLVALADLPTQKPDTKFKGCVVKGCPQRDTRAERQGGLIERDMDLALSVATAIEGPRKVVFWWTPGKSMIANANIPCIHADPYFGTLKPGESAVAEGLVLFAEGNLEPIIRELASRTRKPGN